MKQRLELIVNISMIAVALLVCAVLTEVLLGVGRPHRVAANKPPAVGLQLAAISDYSWSAHNRTLLIALRNSCEFCERSMPFYKELAQLSSQGKLHAHLLAVLPDDPGTAGSLLHSYGVEIDYRGSVPAASLHVTGTPTLILVNSSGKVIGSWQGELTPENEAPVISTLEAAP